MCRKTLPPGSSIGKDNFNKRLDDIFHRAQKLAFGGGKTIDAFAGINSLYNHGNQPNLHISWLFNFSGKPWLTQKWTQADRTGVLRYRTHPRLWLRAG
jgi:putative alpha-1,2-mannosidase